MATVNPMSNALPLAQQKCLVLGGSGFIGMNLCAALSSRALLVRSFSRRPSGSDAIEWFQGDFLNTDDLVKATAGMDTVFHLVSTTVPASSNLDPVADANANIVQSLQLLEACRVNKVSRVIFASSGGTIYGETISVPIAEDHPVQPISSYGIGKLTVEKYLHLYEKAHGLSGIALRISNPYGPYQDSIKKQGVIAHFISAGLQSQPIQIWGDGSVVRDYVYIDDVINSLLLAAEYNGSQMVFNVGSGVGYSLNDVAATVSSALGQPLKLSYTEARSVDVSKNILDCRLAQAELKWIAHCALAAGIEKTVTWKKAHAMKTQTQS